MAFLKSILIMWNRILHFRTKLLWYQNFSFDFQRILVALWYFHISNLNQDWTEENPSRQVQFKRKLAEFETVWEFRHLSFNERKKYYIYLFFILFIWFTIEILKSREIWLKSFEKLLHFSRSRPIVTRGSVSLSCDTTPHPSCLSKS